MLSFFGIGTERDGKDCTHLGSIVEKFNINVFKTGCESCGHSKKGNWMCVTCGYIGCGRSEKKHMIKHNKSHKSHCVVMGLDDLTFWCYKCNRYIISRDLDKIYSTAHFAKFGVYPQNLFIRAPLYEKPDSPCRGDWDSFSKSLFPVRYLEKDKGTGEEDESSSEEEDEVEEVDSEKTREEVWGGILEKIRVNEPEDKDEPDAKKEEEEKKVGEAWLEKKEEDDEEEEVEVDSEKVEMEGSEEKTPSASDKKEKEKEKSRSGSRIIWQTLPSWANTIKTNPYRNSMRSILKRKGFKYKSFIDYDGNCQFSSVSDLIYGTPAKEYLVRFMAVKWLKRNKRRVKSFVNYERYRTWDNYVARMSRDGTWGDQVSLVAIANAFGIEISVISNVVEDGFVNSVRPFKKGKTKNHIHLCLYHNFHYRSIVKIDAE